jgi:beta-lactamase regulating signal transducer with metallopeptidase domain
LIRAESWLAWIANASWQLVPFVLLVWMLSLVLRRGSARLRHGLWLLVLLKIALPPSVGSPWSIGGISGVINSPFGWVLPSGVAVAPGSHSSFAINSTDLEGQAPSAMISARTAEVESSWSRPQRLLIVWACGAFVYLLTVSIPYLSLVRQLRSANWIEEGPLVVQLHRLAGRISNSSVLPALVISEEITSPFLYGLLKPRIVLPTSLVAELSPQQLDEVLLHELMHWKRRDVLISWLQVAAQLVFWFHPLVWFANFRLREERENSCDEAVISAGHANARDYADSLLKVLLASRGRSSAATGFLGIFERSSRLQQRLERILMQENRPHRFGWGGYAMLACLAIILLPLCGPRMAVAKPGAAVVEPVAATAEQAIAPITPPPAIVSTSPSIGAQDVDPATTCISVTFDQNMTRGMSWTGGGSVFPQAPQGETPHWVDERTCVLPVKLEAGRFYRVGINSTSYQNFASESGPAAEPASIFFTTAGASAEVNDLLLAPRAISFSPENGAGGVDPNLKQIRVTFDREMSSGFSWTGGGPEYPGATSAGAATWSADRKTCTLPVELAPAHSYRLGLNSASYQNFASAAGVPLEPIVYTFSTANKTD